MKYFLSLVVSLIMVQWANAQNILPNSGLEEWHDSLGVLMPVGWFTIEAQSPGTAIRSDHAHTGNYAIELITLNQNDVGCLLQPGVPVLGGKKYNLSLYHTCSSFGGGVMIYLAEISVSDTQLTIEHSFFSDTTWTCFDTNFTSHGNTVKILLSCVNMSLSYDLSLYLDDINLSEVEGVDENAKHKLQNTELEIHPNPFIHSTLIQYHLPTKTKVSLKIYDITGRLVKTSVNTEKEAGSYNINLNAKDLPSGIYFAKLEAGNYEETKKLILVR